MSDIDWSKAPEGATHFNPENERFYRFNGEQFEVWSSFQERWKAASGVFEEYAAAWVIRPASAWTGEGLPPVGAAVDCMCTAKTKARDWFPAEVKYISPYTVVLADYSTEELDGEFVAHPATLNFRPRRSPEQIAAEEREKAIAEAMKVMAGSGVHCSAEACRNIAAAYVDAGYRKTEAP